MELWDYERQAWNSGAETVCGVDEAGAGPLMGPVYAAAVILPRELDIPGLNDSKKLTEKKREALYEVITTQAVSWSVTRVEAWEIDEMDILNARMLAMQRAIEGLSVRPDTAFIDGNRDHGSRYAIETPHQLIVGGWLEQKDQRLAQEASQEAARRKSIEKELEWVRQGTKGRQSKGKARLARFEELNSTEYQKRNETNELFIPPGPRLGDKVLEVSNLRKSYGDRLLIDDLSFSIPKGAIVGIIGPNGAGKSTLFRMISGQEQPDSGTITLGETVKLASVDQFRDSMDNSKTVWEEVSGGLDIMKIGNTEMPSRAYVGRFNFKGVDQGKRVGELSGGERGRLHLAKLLQVGGNMLLLDEPTNDLDIETLRALENALLEFPGCAMVISHDRWFLDRIATHILDYQDEGKVEFFEGNFTEYEEYKKRTLGADALEPKRIKYKRIAK